MRLSQREDVLYAHPNYLVAKEWRGFWQNEPYFSWQWHLDNKGQSKGKKGADIDVKKAWEINSGSSQI